MKILVVHNDYGKYSGEEAVVDRMIREYVASGHTVETLRRTSEHSRDTLTGKIHGFFAGIYSISGRRDMRKALRSFRPDIVHIHNLYPFISPAVLPLCKRAGVPVVMTVHNYRLICPTGLFLRNGRPCENCLKNGNERDCIRYNCEHSRLRSLGYALRGMVARRMRWYIDNVDYFCCLTEFQKKKLVEAGYNKDKIFVFPNYLEDGETDATTISPANGGFVGYVGRLSHEKGCDLLIEVARRHPEIPFRMAGELRDGKKIDVPNNVELCGQIDKKHLAQFYDLSRYIVVPSRCYEGFPLVLLEAAKHSRPCIAPAHGPFPELLTDPDTHQAGGRFFKPGDVDGLEQTVVELWNNTTLCGQLGDTAQNNYKKRFLKDEIISSWDKFILTIAK